MTVEIPTRLTINVSPDFRDALKIQAITQGKTLKEYLTEALMDRLQQNTDAEDRAWRSVSDAAIEEGLLNPQESEALLTRMKSA